LILVWDIAFEDLEPAYLNNRIVAIRIVRVAGEKPVLNTLYIDAAYDGCSVGVFKVPVEVNQKPMTSRCTDLAAVQVGNGLYFVALRAEISRSVASSFT
jgi:hypothetical protein